MNPFRSTIIDHGGAERTLYPIHRIALSARRRSELAPGLLDRLHARLAPRYSRQFSPRLYDRIRRVAWFMAAAFATLAIVAWTQRSRTPLGGTWFVWTINLPIWVWMALGRPYHLPRADLHKIMVALLAEGHCASCGYHIGAATPDVAGLTACPECGAQWRMPVDKPAP